MFRGVLDQRPPAAADVQQTFARPQPQLAADVIHLAFLGRLQVVVGSEKIDAGVEHPAVEPQTNEVVGKVVVVADSLAVAFQRMFWAIELDGLLSVVARPALFGKAEQHHRPSHLIPHGALLGDEMGDEAEQSVDGALDVEVVVGVGLGEGGAVGQPEHLAQGAGVLQDQREVRRLAGVGLPGAAVPAAHREVAGVVRGG